MSSSVGRNGARPSKWFGGQRPPLQTAQKIPMADFFARLREENGRKWSVGNETRVFPSNFFPECYRAALRWH